MSQKRQDLLYLTPEALAQILNRGLVKRAERELASNSPSLHLDQHNTLHATFADGIQTTWATDVAIADSQCSCNATNVCRHRIIAVLAYQKNNEQAPVALSSPADITETQLQQHIPQTELLLAEKQRNTGIRIEVFQSGSNQPCPTARLPTATVRFWTGAALETAHCDCIKGRNCQHIALSVWAFIQTAQTQTDAPHSIVQLGTATETLSLELTPYHNLIESLLLKGVEQGADIHAQAITHAQQAASNIGATWLQLLLGDIETWSQAYTARSAGYQPIQGYQLISELALRLTTGQQPGRAKPALGVGQPQQSQLDRLRLLTLGAHIEYDNQHCRSRTILIDLDTQSHFVLEHHWPCPDAKAITRTLKTQRPAPGVQLAALMQGQLLAQQAHRRADGTLLLARARSAQNNLLPQDGDWSGLAPPLCFTHLSALRQTKHLHPLPMTEPRHAADHFVVFQLPLENTAPLDVFYDPDQQIVATAIADADNTPVLIKHPHQANGSHALDASAAALTGKFGQLRHIAGLLTWQHGQACIQPWGYACDRIIIPDIEPANGALAKLPIGQVETTTTDPIEQLLTQTSQCLSTLLHHGLDQLPTYWFEQLNTLQQSLQQNSLSLLAQQLAILQNTLIAAKANPHNQPLAPTMLKACAWLTLHQQASATLA